eukprot:gene13269-17779_t
MKGSTQLLDLPEYLFLQLMEWLTLDEFSLLDCSFCCHDKRDMILNCISSATIYSPLTYPGYRVGWWMDSYWSWLQTRKIYFKDISLQCINEAYLFARFYINPLTKESAYVLGNTMKKFNIDFLCDDSITEWHDLSNELDNILLAIKLFNCLESFSCRHCLISENILKSTLSHFTKLNTLSFVDLPHISDVELSSILAVCRSTIKELNISYCFGISGTNISPLLLTNLSHFDYSGGSLEGLLCMSLGLTGLQKLKLFGMHSSLSEDSFRKTFINLKSLISVEVSDLIGVDFHHAISPTLQELAVTNCANLTYGGLCDIFSSNNLTNLVSLELNSLPLLLAGNGEVHHLPPLPCSLNRLVLRNSFSFHLPSCLSSLTISLLRFSDAGMNQLLSNKPQNLSKVKIFCPNLTSEGLDEILPLSIKELQLGNCGIANKGLCNILSNDWPDLFRLDLSYCHIIDFGESFRLSASKLHSLNLNLNSEMTDDGLYHLFLHNNLVNLTELYMTDLSRITNLALRPSLPQSLVTLNISGMINLTDQGLKQLLSNNLINLRNFNASMCITITCHGLTGVLPSSVEYLNFCRCTSLTCKGLFNLLMSSSLCLKKIDISGSGIDKKYSKSAIPGIVKFIMSVMAPNATLIGGSNELFDF